MNCQADEFISRSQKGLSTSTHVVAVIYHNRRHQLSILPETILNDDL